MKPTALSASLVRFVAGLLLLCASGVSLSQTGKTELLWL